MSPFFFHNTLKYTYTLAHKQAAHGTTHSYTQTQYVVFVFSLRHFHKQKKRRMSVNIPWNTQINSRDCALVWTLLVAVKLWAACLLSPWLHKSTTYMTGGGWSEHLPSGIDVNIVICHSNIQRIPFQLSEPGQVCVWGSCVCVWSWMPCEPAAGLWVKWTKIPAVAISQCKHESFA